MSKATDIIKANFMAQVKDFMEQNGEEVLLVKSGTFSIPFVDEETGEEGYINLTFSIPKGERGGDGYDGHAEAENYKFECEEKAAKAAERKAKAEAKKVRDAELRAAKTKTKAEAEE
jgi:hypothetical protein